MSEYRKNNENRSETQIINRAKADALDLLKKKPISSLFADQTTDSDPTNTALNITPEIQKVFNKARKDLSLNDYEFQLYLISFTEIYKPDAIGH